MAKLEAKPHNFLQNAFLFPLARVLSWGIMALCGPYRVIGRKNVPRKGGILILPNHLSDSDPFLVQLACPRNLFFMAKAELFDIKWLATAMRMGGTFGVKRDEPDRAPLRHAANLLKLDQALCVFPEGQLSEDHKLQEIRHGIALIIRMAECPVICLGLEGTERIIPYGTTLPRPGFHRVTARWGEVRQFDKSATTEEIVTWVEAQLRQLTGQ